MHSFLLLPRATTAMKEISGDFTCFCGKLYRMFQKELYNFESLSAFIQRKCTVF
jgi:hypothetical protein